MTNPNDTVDLIRAIEDKAQKVHTQSLDISFNELLDMYKNDELNISPEYQRLFLWSEGTRSRFIESLLLEMPVPPIFVIEEDDGKYILIDGLQRISSYLHLRGELIAEHLDPPINSGDKLTLTECDIVPELNDKTFDQLGTSLQIRLKRAFVRVEIIRKGSPAHFKYHMFKRLNTGGKLLTEQQIRNCTIRLLDPKFNDFIIELSKTEHFRACIDTIGENRFLEAYDQELVLRFFALKNYREKYKSYLGDFLTEYMEYVSEPKNNVFDYEKEKEIFNKTFEVFYKTLEVYSFSYGFREEHFVKGFSANQYEALTVGIQQVLNKIDTTNLKSLENLKTRFTAIKKDETFKTLTTGGGKNSKRFLNERINFVANALAHDYES